MHHCTLLEIGFMIRYIFLFLAFYLITIAPATTSILKPPFQSLTEIELNTDQK